MSGSLARRVLVLLSGGMDSTTLLAKAVHEYDRPKSPVSPINAIRAISFNYGSKHSQLELEAAAKVARFYGVPHHIVNLCEAFAGFQSALLSDGPAVPEGHYQEESMRQTVVPGRNLILLAIAAGYAESQGMSDVWIGAHSGDHFIYPDCRPEFIWSAQETVRTSSNGKVVLSAPFLNDDKTTIIEWGGSKGVPYQYTRTCYTDQKIACGRCGSCQERLEAFLANHIADPIPYASREILPKTVTVK